MKFKAKAKQKRRREGKAEGTEGGQTRQQPTVEVGP